jgi:hypothetical protein
MHLSVKPDPRLDLPVRLLVDHEVIGWICKRSNAFS